VRVAPVIFALVLAVPATAQAADPADPIKRLIDRADTVLRGKSSAGVLTMEVKTQSYERSFKIVIWDDSSDPKRERTLIKILGPALWRGHGTLKVGDHLKLYNPRTNHVTVVSHSMLGDSWMGSHFTNDDLVKETRLARHYTHKLLKRWQGVNEAGQAVTFYRVKLTPKPTAPVAWGKIVYDLWERDEVVLPTRATYHRKANGPADRTLTFSKVKRMGGRELPAEMKMTVAKKPGEHTSIVYKTIKFDISIPDKKFTEQALRH
jgi:hypothetical protein